jgi:hypothetical protein
VALGRRKKERSTGQTMPMVSTSPLHGRLCARIRPAPCVVLLVLLSMHEWLAVRCAVPLLRCVRWLRQDREREQWGTMHTQCAQ